MKRIINLLMFCLLFSQACLAQDIIITRDSKRIDAKVEEITDTEVKYHRQDNLNGPIFVIKTSQVSSIVFANGEVQTFELEEGKENTVQQSEEEGKRVVFASGRTVIYQSGKKMEYRDGAFYYGGMRLGDDEYASFLEQICPDAYNKYQTRIGWEVIGDIFLYGGSSAVGWGLGGLIFDSESSGITSDLSFIVWGVVFQLASIPFYVAETACKSKSTDIFNDRCSVPQRRQPLSLSFNMTPVSAGITLNF